MGEKLKDLSTEALDSDQANKLKQQQKKLTEELEELKEKLKKLTE